jgi:hypothetical protein
MSSLTDHPDDSSIGGRLLSLGQVSEAATALAGTRVPKQLSDIQGVSRISPGPIAADKSISLSVRHDDSVDPAVHVANTHVRSSSKLAIFTRLIIILAVVVTTLTLSEDLSRTDIRQWLTNDGLTEAFSLPVTSDPVTAISARPSPKLMIQPSRGPLDEPVPLGLEVDGLAEEVVVYIEGLVPGMELSMGTPVGADAWQIPATDLGYAWIAPPRGFVGTAKLTAELRLPDNRIADRQAIHFAWESPSAPAHVLHQSEERAALQSISSDPAHIQPDQTEAGSSQALVTRRAGFDTKEIAVMRSIPLARVHLQHGVRRSKLPASMLRQPDANEIAAVLKPVQLKPERDKIVPADSLAPALQRQLDEQEIMLLLKRGKDLIAAGDLAAARLVLRKAADANNAEAALALGATYDPFVLRELKVYGFTPDAAMARVWYEKATGLGSPAAPRRLEMLTQETGTH